MESELAAHVGVIEAFVFARERAHSDRVLDAYVAPRGTMPEAESLREHLRARLPAFMIPSAFVEIAAVPLTPIGKVDRAALPAPAMTATVARHVPARDPLEARLLAPWEEVPGTRSIALKD